MKQLRKNVKDFGGIKGVVTLSSFVLDTPEAIEIDSILESAFDMQAEKYAGYVQRLKEICEVRSFSFQNQVVLSGRSIFARLLVDDTTYTGEITHGALGTGSTAVSDADTVLDTEAVRKQIASRTRTDDSVVIDFYYSKSDGNGTYEEFGTFIDGTGTVDTGQLFNRVLTGGWTKSSSEALTVSIQFDINAA